MKKKAIIYTTAAIALTIVIIMTYSQYNAYRLRERMEVIQTRIETLNFFVKDVESDLGKGAYIAGFRTLLAFNQFISSNGSFIAHVNERFNESFLDGTINQSPMSLMSGSTFTEWAKKISSQANKTDIVFNYTIHDVRLNQSDPWGVVVGLNITLNLTDRRGTSAWIRNSYLIRRISIIGFEDPLYLVNSKGRVTNTIRAPPTTEFVTGTDVTNLLKHANNSYYLARNDSPSYLMRLQGTLENSSLGIESLVNLEKFQSQGFAINDRSVVDYIYFGSKNIVKYRINKTPEWFKLDNESDHLGLYNASKVYCKPSDTVCVSS